MMNRYLLLVTSVLAIVLCTIPYSQASSTLATDYVMTVGSTTFTASAGTVAISGSGTQPYNGDIFAGPLDIGFSFNFGGTAYNKFTVNAHGMMMLGTSGTSSFNNNLAGADVYPVIAPLWDQQHLRDRTAGATEACVIPPPAVRHDVSGAAPNRVLTVEWRVHLWSQGGDIGDGYFWYSCGSLVMMQYQAKLYEGSNRIEFIYGTLYQSASVGSRVPTSASIGIAQSTSDFLSITPGSPATVSAVKTNNKVVLHDAPIAFGTVYTFTPCGFVTEGRIGVGNGGTVAMSEGDILFDGFSAEVGNSATYTPFTLKVPANILCATRSYTLTISGSTEYYFGIPGQNVLSGTLKQSESTTPNITFAPTGSGKRLATLTIRDNTSGISRSYTLGATAPRIKWLGNIAQGGTAKVLNGDILLSDKVVLIHNTQVFNPLTIQNISTDFKEKPASVTYALDDPTGSYSISPVSASLTALQSSSVNITFNATGSGPKIATLTVTADGEKRVYTLAAVSSAPGGELLVNGEKIGLNTPLLANSFACAGEGVVSIALTAVNVGFGDFEVSSVEAYKTDTAYGQGTPPYDVIFDESGNPIPMNDYFISEQPGVAPRLANGQLGTIVVPQGQTKIFYLNLIPVRPEKRYARIFFHTNATNLNDPDITGENSAGTVGSYALGRGRGSHLASSRAGKNFGSTSFPITEIRTSSIVTTTVYNSGTCDLRIGKDELQLTSGDINEFEIVSVMPGVPVDASTNDFVIAPGDSGAVTMRFTPRRSGSRRATIWMKTNDSTIGIPGVAERGSFYWDVFGSGKVKLDARDADLPPAVIDATTSTGEVVVENASTEAESIVSVKILGTGNTEIIQHTGGNPTIVWPAFPYRMKPGDRLRLGLDFIPLPGSSPGVRMVTLEIALANGDTLRVQATALGGTRLLTVQPPALFQSTSIKVGKETRQYATVTNNGTFPVRLQGMQITGATANYKVGALRRVVLEPGQSEFVEVTFTPKTAGMSSGNLVITSNSTNGVPAGTHTVMLGGQASSVKAGGGGVTGDASIWNSANGSGASPNLQGNGLTGSSTSSVATHDLVSGITLGQNVPNPANGIVEIAYTIPGESTVLLELYDVRGSLVRTLEQGNRSAGDYVVRFNTANVASGQYTYRLVVNGTALARQMMISK